MLKHKLRKSRKNILSLLDYAQEQEDENKFPEYSEIKKPSRKEKKKKGDLNFYLVCVSIFGIEGNLSSLIETCSQTE